MRHVSLLALLLSACDDPVQKDTSTPSWGGRLLVADTGHGRAHLASREPAHGLGDLCLSTVLSERCSAEARAPDDATCLFFGPSLDDVDGVPRITFPWGRRSDRVRGIPGGLAQVRFEAAGPTLSWSSDVLRYPRDAAMDATCTATPDTEDRCRLQMAHAQVEAPDGRWVVADTLNNRVVWLRPGTTPTEPASVEAVIGAGHRDNPGAWYPNALTWLDATTLLVSYKGNDPRAWSEPNNGRLLAWDVEDPSMPALRWAWPADGTLAAVHGVQVQTTSDGRRWVLYGHAFGASASGVDGDHGSVGVAEMPADGGPPRYVADLVLDSDDGAPLGFVREARLVDEGSALLVTDSGCENDQAGCALPGQVLSLDLDAVDGLAGLASAADGRSGAFDGAHAQQRFVSLRRRGDAYTAPLKFPFSAMLLPDGALPGLEALGACARE